MPDKHDTADDQAADWAVLLADAPDDGDQQARFAAWLNADPAHAEAWARVKRAWDGLGQLEATTRPHWPGRDGDSQAGNVTPLPAPSSGRRRPHRLTHLAGLALAASLLLLLLPDIRLHISADHLTGTGEQRRLRLDDGSRIHLAPESAIRLTLNDRQRQVELLQGEAFFNVAPDTRRPFRVISGDTHTTVLGTAFDVNRSAKGTRVSVEHGRVQVEDSRTGTRQTLTAGDQLAIVHGETATLSRIPPTDVAGWRKGQLIARDRTIGQVVDALRPYQSGTIIVTEPFSRQRVTGLYRLNEPATTLKKLAAAHGGTVHQITPWVLVLSH